MPNDLFSPRPFSGMEDLKMMWELLAAGRKAANGTYYPHIGDLSWWLFYPPIKFERWKDIFLWDDPRSSCKLVGWALISPEDYLFDVYLQPDERGSERAEAIYQWAEAQVTALARRENADRVGAMWIDENDPVLRRRLESRDFQPVSWDVCMSRRLERLPPAPDLPTGFQVRGCRGEVELVTRATAQRSAFGTQIPFDLYLQRWQRFMRSPVYNPELDVVVATPDGSIAAFCKIWLDPLNRVGCFEPVGTHPDFQRRGFGTAVMFEGFRRLKQRGMLRAQVCTLERLEPAVNLYQSVGFTLERRLGYFKKKIDR